MKLTTFVLIVFTLNISATVYSQKTKLSLEVNNKSIKEILFQIENQSDFRFIFETDQVDLSRKVSIQAKDQTAETILNKLFAQEGIQYVITENNLILINPFQMRNNRLAEVLIALQTGKRITGTVIDERGEAVIGANVVEKGTTNGVITDIDGKFNLSVKENATLDITYIGYVAQSIPILNQTNFSIILREDTQSLDEIVVIGYGVVKKSDLTGSVTRVGTEELARLPVSSIDKALQGRAAGVQISSVGGAPGAGTSIRIRGGNSISADNEPLYVIDGFIGGGDLNSLNPADIESIEILKDATATAIYGSRGANGVIMITTKKGKEGVSKIAVNFYQGFQSLPRKLPFMEGPDRAAYANAHAEYTNTEIPFPDLSKVTHTDWQDLLTRIAPMTNVDMSLSGGSNDFQHYISANYFNQDGVYRGSSFTRYQARINLDKKLFDWLKVGILTNASSLHTDNAKFSYLNYIKEASTVSPVYNEDGSYNYINPISGQVFENPMANVDLLKNDTYKKRFLGNFYVEISPLKNMIIRSTIGGDFLSTKQENYSPGTLPIRQEQGVGGYARIDNGDYFSLLNENTANYLFDFKDIHHFNVMGGITVQKERSTSSWTSVEGFTNDLMEFHNLAAGDPSTAKYGSGYSASQMISFLGRINYSLSNRYLLTITGRYDGSSRLAKNHKWAFFPSAAIAWRLSEEQFIRNLELFHNLKFRASYGMIGNQAIGVYESLASLSVVSPTFGGNKDVGYILSNMSNPNLKWETTKQLDLGLDIAFFKGRLSLEFDYYYKRTKDLLMDVEIPWTSGYKTQLQNIGEVQNQGIELLVNANLIHNKAWNWDINFNVSRNRNKVLDIGDSKYIDLTNGVRLYKGQPAGVFVGAIYEGTWKSQAEIDANPNYMPGARPGTARFKDVNGNGKYDGVEDYAILGNAEPAFFGGFGTNVSYKNIDLELFFQGTYGNEIRNAHSAEIFFGGFGANLYKLEGEQPWTEENNMSNVPASGSLGYHTNVNTMAYSPSIQDGSYLKLKTLKFNYSLPVEKISGINKLNIYLLCSNLFTWTNYNWGYDPDVTGSDSVIRGVDGMAYPQNRSFQIGFDINF